MGLLDDFLSSDSTRMGIGLLAAGGPRTDGAGFGQRMQEVISGMDAYKKQKLMQQMQDMQMQEMQQKVQQEKAMRTAASESFVTPDQARARSMGPTLDGTEPPMVQPGFDNATYIQNLYKANVPEKAMAWQMAIKKEQPKYSTAPQYDQTGRAFILAENGEMKYLDGVKARDKLEEVRLGDKVGFRSPYSAEIQGSLPLGQSPDGKASNAVAWANNELTRVRDAATDARAKERLAFEQGGGAESGGATQVQFNKQFGKAPAGYRWTPAGAMEFIPGGPADQKAQAQKGGEGTVGGIVADLRDKYSQLDAENGIVSTRNRFGTNMGAAFGASGVGQTLNGMVGTKTQSARDSIAMTRPLLLQSIMKATGMSAKQMDSNAELKLYLSTATDPQKGLQANMEALDRIESLYGGGNEKFKSLQPHPKNASGWSIQKAD